MNKPILFKISCRRDNLFLEIREKTKSVINDIAELINSKKDTNFILYCNTKKHCEDLSSKLYKEFKIKSEIFHSFVPRELSIKD